MPCPCPSNVRKRTDPEPDEVPWGAAPLIHVACLSLTSALPFVILVLRQVAFLLLFVCFPTATMCQHGDGRCGRENCWEWALQVSPGWSGPVSHSLWGSPLLSAGGLKAFSLASPRLRGLTTVCTEDLPATVLRDAQRLKVPLARLLVDGPDGLPLLCWSQAGSEAGPMDARGPRPRPVHTRPPGTGSRPGQPGGPGLQRGRQSPRART